MSKRNMSRTESKLMADRIEAQKAANKQLERDEAARRASCPVELAKTFLRQRGWPVFKANVLPGFSKCTIDIMVGTMQLTPDEVIEMAARIRERRLAA